VNGVQVARQKHDAEQQKHAMRKRGHTGLAACIDVGRTAHDDGSHWQAANQAADNIADTLRLQFAIGGRKTFQRVQLIGRFKT